MLKKDIMNKYRDCPCKKCKDRFCQFHDTDAKCDKRRKWEREEK